MFNWLPVAALIDEKILCMHGGLSPELSDIKQITALPRPTDVPDQGKGINLLNITIYFNIFAGLLCDLLWSDPEKTANGFVDNERGVSYVFSEKIVEDFNRNNDLDLIIRAHQVVEEGFEFFANRQLITIFSAPNYCGEFDNSAGILMIDESLICSIKVLRPVENYNGDR